MNFRLADSSRLEAAGFTPDHVWYSKGFTLHRRSLETLVEEFMFYFATDIAVIWTFGETIAVVTVDFEIYVRRDQKWTGAGSSRTESPYAWGMQCSHVHPSARYCIFYDDGVVLVCASRTVDRVKKLLKDETLAARVCHYLQ